MTKLLCLSFNFQEGQRGDDRYFESCRYCMKSLSYVLLRSELATLGIHIMRHVLWVHPKDQLEACISHCVSHSDALYLCRPLSDSSGVQIPYLTIGVPDKRSIAVLWRFSGLTEKLEAVSCMSACFLGWVLSVPSKLVIDCILAVMIIARLASITVHLRRVESIDSDRSNFSRFYRAVCRLSVPTAWTRNCRA